MTASAKKPETRIRPAIPIAIDKIVPYANNTKTHSEAQIKELMKSIRRFGWTNPILVTAPDAQGRYTLIAGEGRWTAAKRVGLKEVSGVVLDHLTEDERRAYVIADNKLAELGGWDLKKLSEEVSSLVMTNFDVTMLGFSDKELDELMRNTGSLLPNNSKVFAQLPQSSVTKAPRKKKAVTLSEKFIVPPFSYFDAREPWWQDRLKNWKAIGLDRNKALENGVFANKNEAAPGYEQENDYEGPKFDPVLTEIFYRWFVPKTGNGILDFFHGSAVKGIVASKLGLKYTGVDIEPRLSEQNNAIAAELCKDDKQKPLYIAGDAREVKELVPPLMYDAIFASISPDDIWAYSGQNSYDQFVESLKDIVFRSVELLEDNRFAGIVFSDIRDKATGFYCGLLKDVIDAFEDAGMSLYNDAVMINVPGSMPLRAGRYFSQSRKLGKTHYNVLVFVKGDPKEATRACGKVDTSEIEALK